MKIAKKITSIICDDARQEIGGKISLMGIYTDIVINKTPSLLPMLSFVVILEGVKRKFKDMKVVLTIPEIKPLEISMKAPGNLEIGGNNNFVFAVSPLKIEAPGKGLFEFFVEDDEKPSIKHDFIITSNNLA